VDKLSIVFGYIYTIVTFIGVLFALKVKDDLQHVMALTYAGAALEVRTSELRRLSSKILEAQEEERKRISLELHDSIAQSLSAVKFSLETKLNEMGGSAAPQGTSLEDIFSRLKDCIEETRMIMTNLRPSLLDDLGILATINWKCREYQKVYSGINVEKQIDIQEDDVPEPLKIVIYRIIQEACNNVAKHSRADAMRLSLRKAGKKIEFSLVDNGTGFDVEQALSVVQPERGIGLASMKERTELSGGSFSIHSQKGVGTTVYASWTL
jgi:signal transduction histidine kinase